MLASKRIALLSAALAIVLLIGAACLPTRPAGTPPVTSTAPDPAATSAARATAYPPPGTAAPLPSGTLTGSWVYLPVIVAPGGVTAVAAVTGTDAATGTSTETPTITQTPTPSLTPTPRWPPPLETPGLSKIGLHLIQNDSPDIMEFMRVTKPPVVKSLDDFGFFAEIKDFSPTTVTIGRIGLYEQPMDGDPIARAQAFVADHLATYQQYPATDYWEGYNEPATSIAAMQWYAQFEAERTRLMAAHGWRVAIGQFSVGTPELSEMEAFLPAIQAAKDNGGILGLHEYGAPTLDYGIGDSIPGVAGAPDRGPYMLRYRFYYDALFKPRGLVIPLVISEAGIDGGITNRPGPAGLGWRDFDPYWGKIGRRAGSSGYIEQLAWYDQEVQKDDYVIGLTIFTVGGSSMDEWRSFDITSILTKLARYAVTQVR